MPEKIDDTLLLCVDMQPAFIRPIFEAERVRQRCEFALTAAFGIGIPIGFTEQVPHKLGGTDPGLRAIAPEAPVWSKNAFCALADSRIRAALVTQLRVRRLLVCGVETSICVYQTAAGALAEGMEVTVLSDAVGARRPEDARTCLEALARAGARVLPSETILYGFVRDVSHPYFRVFTDLVKRHFSANS